MLLILDVDYTLNQFYPPSLPDIAPAGLIEQSGPPMWEWITQHLKEVEYPVWEKAVEIVHWLHQCKPTVIVSTGRPEALRGVTERWLRRYFRFDTLLMRQADDFRPNAEIKQDALQKNIVPRIGEKRVYAFEDDATTLTMYQQEGIQTFTAPACWEQLQPHMQESEPAAIHSVLASYTGLDTGDV